MCARENFLTVTCHLSHLINWLLTAELHQILPPHPPLPPHPEPLQFPRVEQPVQRVLSDIQQVHDLSGRQVLADGLPLVQAVVIIIIVHGLFTPFRPIWGFMSLFDVILVFQNDTLFKRTSAEPGVSLRLRVLRMFLFLAGKTERTSGIQKSAAIFPKN